MKRPPPVHPRYHGRVRKIRNLESNIIGAEREPSPYLHQSVVESCSNNQSRVGGEQREFNRVREGLFPHETRRIVEEPKEEARIARK